MTDAPAMPSPEELRELERLAVSVATEAGRLVLDRPGDLGVASTKSSGTDIVTVMDERAQDLIRTRLAAARPADGFHGEEVGGSARAESSITWVVDPIDGTVNYLYDIPAYAVSVAAVVGDPTVPGSWHPVAGAVVGPALGETYRARVGGGAFRRRGQGPESAIAPSGCTSLALSLVGTGFSYDAALRRWGAQVLVETLPLIRDIRRIGSAALDLCHVADGSLDGYYERGLNPWDLAAGWLVATEAGARAIEVPTSELTWAAAPGIAEGLERVVRAAIGRVPAVGQPSGSTEG